ncbi:MAG: hypothetical protein JWP04_1829, partial [Belnapia sp.]|nr:hypothetical protein [Belnapia sp.]
ENAGTTVIALGDGNLVILAGVPMAALGAADFLFG